MSTSYFVYFCSSCSLHYEQWTSKLMLSDSESLFQLYLCSFLYILSFYFHFPIYFLQILFVLILINHLIKILYTRENNIYRKSLKHTCDLRWTVNFIHTTADFLANHVVADEDIIPKSNSHSSILTWPPWELALHSFFLIAHWTSSTQR